MSYRTRTFGAIKRFVQLTTIVGAALYLVGCGAGSGQKSTMKLEDIVVKANHATEETQQINSRLFAAQSGGSPAQDYILGEGDLIQVHVFEAEKLGTEVRIGAQGFITLPLLGPIQVKGLTTNEAERKIEALYRSKYLRDPHVSVSLREQIAGKITVLGAVNKPGTYPHLTRHRLFNALAMAEGLSDRAGRMVQVRRAGDDPEHPSTFLIDLDKAVKSGQTTLNIEIIAGDEIYVAEAGSVYVDGAIRKPGTYPIKGDMTIQEAIVSAGGLASIADQGNIKLVRNQPDGQREVVQLSFDEVQKDPNRNFLVQDRDVIFVETHGYKALLYGLRLNLGGGLFGIGYTPPEYR